MASLGWQFQRALSSLLSSKAGHQRYYPTYNDNEKYPTKTRKCLSIQYLLASSFPSCFSPKFFLPPRFIDGAAPSSSFWGEESSNGQCGSLGNLQTIGSQPPAPYYFYQVFGYHRWYRPGPQDIQICYIGLQVLFLLPVVCQPTSVQDIADDRIGISWLHQRSLFRISFDLLWCICWLKQVAMGKPYPYLKSAIYVRMLLKLFLIWHNCHFAPAKETRSCNYTRSIKQNSLNWFIIGAEIIGRPNIETRSLEFASSMSRRFMSKWANLNINKTRRLYKIGYWACSIYCKDLLILVWQLGANFVKKDVSLKPDNFLIAYQNHPTPHSCWLKY